MRYSTAFLLVIQVALTGAVFGGENMRDIFTDDHEADRLRSLLPDAVAGIEKEFKQSGASMSTANKVQTIISACKSKFKDTDSEAKRRNILKCCRLAWVINIRVLKNANDDGVKEFIIKQWNDELSSENKLDRLALIAALGEEWNSRLLTDKLWNVFHSSNDQETIKGLVFAIYKQGGKPEIAQLEKRLANTKDVNIGETIMNGLNWLNYRLDKSQDPHGPASLAPGRILE